MHSRLTAVFLIMIYISPTLCGCGVRPPAHKVRYELWYLRCGTLERAQVAGTPQFLTKTAASLGLEELRQNGNPELMYYIITVEWLAANP